MPLRRAVERALEEADAARMGPMSGRFESLPMPVADAHLLALWQEVLGEMVVGAGVPRRMLRSCGRCRDLGRVVSPMGPSMLCPECYANGPVL